MKVGLYACALCFLILEGRGAETATTRGTEQCWRLCPCGWRVDSRRSHEGNKLVPAVVDYGCYRHGGRELAGADAFCLEVTATPVGGTIHIDTNFLKVIAWSKTLIQATSDSGDPDHLLCAISEVTFNPGAKIRHSRRPEEACGRSNRVL
jgi:hypothetical protein